MITVIMRDGDNDSKHRQDDERLVLESIYGDDVRNACGQKAWKVKCFTLFYYFIRLNYMLMGNTNESIEYRVVL